MADNYDNYTHDELVRLLRERDRKPRFGLVWERDEIEHDRAVNDDFVALDFDPTLSYGDAPFRNLIIEGDNFDALRFLRMTHAGKVKCIYIDPPYNTGNKDFIYNDSFIDKDDAYKHSKWLEFMYWRLVVAKELLTEDGVIFISIDDGEACPLKLLMDRIFSANAFIGQFVWKSRQNKDNRTKNGASIDHEYVFAFGHSLRGVERDHEQYKNPDNDPRGPWTSGNMVGLADEKARPNLHYDLINHATNINYGKPRQGWRFDRARMSSLIAENRILWPEKPTGRPRLKVFLNEMSSEFTGFSSIIGEQIFTYHGTRELEDIFDSRVFDFPKPSDLILELIRQGAPNKNDIILDFFAGSGTTAHAVMKLNKEDGGNRRFILVSSTEAIEEKIPPNPPFSKGGTTNEPPFSRGGTEEGADDAHNPSSEKGGIGNQEKRENVDELAAFLPPLQKGGRGGFSNKNLCRDICAERVRRVLQGYVNKKGEAVEGLGGDFAYFRATRIPKGRVYEKIQDAQIWLALQLIHLETFQPFAADKPVQTAEFDHGLIAYCTKVNADTQAELEKLAADYAEVIVYAWQAALLRQHLPAANLIVEAIPAFLMNRFGDSHAT